ncbi:sensor histidine kinase [Deinococcus apachensis]|uniref:sensor histidine kinase n=1 Tax=Deinococcus apachensis TaxID=309886 RepID=UPI0003764D2B|nr:ATP-binding protein [Deinococcus apachensis]
MADPTVPPAPTPPVEPPPQALLDALKSHVAIVDRRGVIVGVNRSWRAFAELNGGDPASSGVGSNYLEASAPHSTMQAGLRAVLDGERSEFELTYPCHAPGERRWFRVRVTPLGERGEVTHAFVEHLNVTPEARGREELRRTHLELRTRVGDRTAELERHTRDLEDRAGALEAFAQFTEVAATTTDPQELARHAARVLGATLGDVAVGYYERGAAGWQAHSLSGGLPAEVEADLGADFPAQLPDELPSGEAVFQEAGATDGVKPFGATALLPLTLHRPGDALLVMGTLTHDLWPEGARAVFRAVGRSFALALERAEQARHLAEQGARLAELNAELTAYTTGLSRDLRDPARRIAGFAGLLEARLAEGDPTVRRHLGIIRSETGRLQALVEDLAQLRPLQERHLSPLPLALAPLVVQVRSDLGHVTRGRRISWTVGALPTVHADHLLLRQVLTHLLHNALKFTGGRDPARIGVGGEEREEDTLVWVRDNGVGFDPEQAERLFQVFIRLHGDEYEGSGVGLANVRRIVHRHGGQVWAEGEPGVGATFFFTLPRPTAPS